VSRAWPRAIEPPEEALLPPRYAPEAELPAYRYVPGLFPHPTAHSDGHSFGRPEPEATPLPPERWRDNPQYLYGVDLFNRRYYWEAHEAWEAFWHACDKARTQGLFIQGLIQISAALLRWHMGTERGVRKLYGEGRAKLERAASESPADYMGLAVAAWLGELNRIFEQLLSALETDDLDPEFPLIRLQL
jgi:uncharacterized protein